jgi:mannitol/fructose-specific phosphotransferase system IIA component (Ntr-type)
MTYWKLFHPQSCSVSLASLTKPQALREVLDVMLDAGELPRARHKDCLTALLEREELATTGVGQGVAIPHVKVPKLERALFSLCLSRTGIEWKSVDGEAVHIVFTALRPAGPTQQHDPEQHLAVMRWIAQLSRNRDFRSFALQAKSSAELLELLEESSG